MDRLGPTPTENIYKNYLLKLALRKTINTLRFRRAIKMKIRYPWVMPKIKRCRSTSYEEACEKIFQEKLNARKEIGRS